MAKVWSDTEFGDLDYWRLCDELSVYEAALLTLGTSPSELPDVEQRNLDRRPRGYEPMKIAIQNALRSGKIRGTVYPLFDDHFDGDPVPIAGSVSLFSSRVEVESLKEWLASHGFREGFFFPEGAEKPDYLDPVNPRYAPKLAAAVRAWQAVTDSAGKPPKQALIKWLREHAVEFRLTDDEGKLNETGIDEVAKVANWQPGGGAPKTPGG